MSTEYEHQDSQNQSIGFGSPTWQCQTFTPSTTHTIDYVVVHLKRNLAGAGTMTVSIRATSGDAPTGSDLVSVGVDRTTIDTSSDADYTFTFSTGILLSASTKYAIVIKDPDIANAGASQIYRQSQDSPDPYSGGECGASSDSGANWTMNSPTPYRDWYFQEWGTPTTNYPANFTLGSFILTGYDLTVTYAQHFYTAALTLGSFALTGLDWVVARPRSAVFTLGQFILSHLPTNIKLKGWTFQSKNSSSFEYPTKHSSTVAQPTKHTSSWVKPTKN